MRSVLDLIYKPAEDIKWQQKSQVAQSELKRKLGFVKRRVNVLVVGLPAAGKSTLIGSLLSCLQEVNGGRVSPDETHGCPVYPALRTSWSLRKTPALSDEDIDVNPESITPVLFDLPGLENASTDVVRTVLIRTMEGNVPIGETYLLNQCSDIQFCDIQKENKIDRLIFVHSYTDTLPESLIDIVVSLCREKDIVMFTVLTHIDTPIKSQLCKQEELDLAFGTYGSLRSFGLELPHNQPNGHSEKLARTEYFLLLLWKALLNQSYPIHSEYPSTIQLEDITES